MEAENTLFELLLTWGVPFLWLGVAALAFQKGNRSSAVFVGVAAIAAILQPALFYAGYGLPGDWPQQVEPLTWNQWIGWFGQYVLPIVSMLGLVIGYGVLLRRT